MIGVLGPRECVQRKKTGRQEKDSLFFWEEIILGGYFISVVYTDQK